MISTEYFKLKKDGSPCSRCFCRTPELIENYDVAVSDTSLWECHHRLETHTSDGERRLVDISYRELIALGMYYDRPPEELIFLTVSEHGSIHKKGRPSWNKGIHHSEEARKKMSEAHKGHKISEEQKRKISETLKGRPSPTKGTHLSEERKAFMSSIHKGRHKIYYWDEDGNRHWRYED